METSSNSNGRSQAQSSDGYSAFRKRSTDQPPSSSALALPSPVSEIRVSPPASELRIKVHLSNDAYTQRRQKIGVERVGTASAFPDREPHFRTSKSACGSSMSRERSNGIQRPFDPDRKDTAMPTKKSRTDDQIMGGSISDDTRELALNFEKREGGRGRDLPFLKGSQAEFDDNLVAAKKAEKSFAKSDYGAQQNGDRGRLCTSVAARVPHKRAFKTMRFLSEVRDCVSEKPVHESHDASGEIRSPSKSFQGAEGGKGYQAKGSFAECCDFPFIVLPIHKRPRSSRRWQGHKKLAAKERHLEDATNRIREAKGVDDLQVGMRIDCRNMVNRETGQGEEDSIKGADATAELSGCRKEGLLQDKSGACPLSVEPERREMVESVEGRRESPLQADGASIVKSEGENQHKASNLNAEMAENSTHEECSVAQRVDIDKERSTSKESLLKLYTDVQPKHTKGLIKMENSEQPKRALQLQGNAACDGTRDISHNVDSYVSQGLTEEPKLGSFQLSLAPPGTLLAEAGYALHAKNDAMAPATTSQLPAHTHVQSQSQAQDFSHSHTQMLSDGYTASLSLSQSLFHNPSCSQNCLSVDNQELSCGGTKYRSHFKENMAKRGWLTAGSANEVDDGSFNVFQDKSKQGHGGSFGQTALNISRTSNLQREDREGPARQGLKHDDVLGRSLKQEEGAPVGATEALSKPLAQVSKMRHHASSSGRHSTAKGEGDETELGGSFGLQELVMEPIALMAQRMQELPDSILESLRSLARDLLRSFEKRGEFLTIQNIIKKRADLTENTLLHAQHTQLEILVALKTGEQAFVQVGAKPLTYKVLTEIFLQTRCRNVTCQQSLPVDGCECKVCSQKGGFCHECMCVVCSKFDSDNQTCRWLGCDFCMHWCHADCGLRMSHIAPALSNKGAAGVTEMQYRCVACGHSTELFGFVKNAFHLFAENWGAETLTKELDCVRRIFHGSEDARGRQLCRKVEAMLQKLDMNVEIIEIRRSMLQYFNGADLDSSGACMVPNNPMNEKVMAMWEAASRTAPATENKLVDEIKFGQSFERELLAKKSKDTAELHIEQACKKAEIDNIHSMMKLKQAEAKMLQLRADEAHQQARGLRQIISIKQDKIEGDFMSKYAKLRLNEAEEKRNKRCLELKALERAHLDYRNMKLRMEAQIRDLTMKMGRASWQYA